MGKEETKKNLATIITSVLDEASKLVSDEEMVRRFGDAPQEVIDAEKWLLIVCDLIVKRMGDDVAGQIIQGFSRNYVDEIIQSL